jgi:DNA-binding MarR family transcriptional regulator
MGFIDDINKAFESRVRLGVMSILMVNASATYSRLKELLGVTDGNLASHLKALEKMEYVLVSKEFVNRKPQTSYSVTKVGKLAFTEHIDALEKLLKHD